MQASTISSKNVIYGSCHCSDGAYQDKYDWAVSDRWSRIERDQVGGCVGRHHR